MCTHTIFHMCRGINMLCLMPFFQADVHVPKCINVPIGLSLPFNRTSKGNQSQWSFKVGQVHVNPQITMLQIIVALLNSTLCQNIAINDLILRHLWMVHIPGSILVCACQGKCKPQFRGHLEESNGTCTNSAITGLNIKYL